MWSDNCFKTRLFRGQNALKRTINVLYQEEIWIFIVVHFKHLFLGAAISEWKFLRESIDGFRHKHECKFLIYG